MGAHEERSLSDYAATVIRNKARRLVGQFSFTATDRADIEQDLAVHILKQLRNFDPRRGNQATFIRRIVDSKVASMIRHRTAMRRDVRRATSIEKLVDRPIADSLPALWHAPPDLAIDMSPVNESLDSDARQLCSMLSRGSIAEAARCLGLTRAEARTRVARLRKLLTDAGLDVYL